MVLGLGKFPWYKKHIILSSVSSAVLATQSTTPAMTSGYRKDLGEVSEESSAQ
jgi:hypothetical protein